MPTPWPHLDYEPRLVYSETDQTWRCLIRARGSQEYTSLEPNLPGHPTPEEALSSAATRVSGLLATREESSAVETLRLLTEGRLRSVEALESGPGGGPPIHTTRWQAQGDDGTWTDPAPTPQEATLVARARRRGVPASVTVPVVSGSPSGPPKV